MSVLQKRKIVLWSLWAVIVLPGLAWTLSRIDFQELLSWELAAFTLLALVVAFLPIQINGTPMFFTQGVTMAVFLKYGLFIEIVLTQITMLVVLYKNQSSQPQSVRFPFNSLMFFITSLVSGLVFFALGGEIGSMNFLHIVVFGLIYQMVHALVNHSILFIDDRIMGKDVPFLSTQTVWDMTITLVIFPFAVMLYVTETVIGLPALLLLSIPFLVVTVLLRMYSSSEIINSDLQKAGHIGHQLAERMTQMEVLDQFAGHVAELFKADYTYIIDYRDGELLMLRMFENGEVVEKAVQPVPYDTGISGQVIVTDEPAFFSKRKEWQNIETWYMPADVESVMATPIARNNKTEGVLLIASRRKFAFGAHQLQIMDLLSTYFAVSLEKANYMEKAVAKSERCGLTKLYNYRYLDNALEKCMEQVNGGGLDSLSLVMMDIDRFKGINDRYGHQSGNDILVELAQLLLEIVGEEGTVARYGGEEFVVLLPNYTKDVALLFSENIRKQIEKHEFVIQSDLDPDREKIAIHITMSIGVSTAPDDSDEAMALVRNADRALYIGAKQAGRNKVAAYAK